MTLPHIREAALLAALCTILAFQQVRFEAYESEKAALVQVFAVVIIATVLVDLSGDFKATLRRMQTAFASPAVLASLMLLILLGISTLTSLDFSSSVWGSDLRFQGWITWGCYLVLFWQATRLSKQAQCAILPVIVIAAVPLCLWSIIQHQSGDVTLARPGSTTGQPDYMSSWLMIAVLYVVPQFYTVFRQWQAPFTIRQRVKIALGIGWIMLVGIAFYLANSRAAVLGLIVGIILFVFVVAALRRSKRILLILSAMCLVIGVAYAAISASVIRSFGIQGTPTGLSRYFYPYDSVRLAVWDGASRLVVSQGVPLTRADGLPDSLAALRPWIGYGPDTTEQTQIRFLGGTYSGAYYPVNVFIDRLHNLVFDSIAISGWLGFVALLTTYLACLYVGLKALGLITPKGIWIWLVAQGLGAVAGVIAVVLFLPTELVLLLAPLGSAVGMILGFLTWIVARTLRTGSQPGVELNPRNLAIISIICIIGAEWIEHQFGYLETASQVLFWILAGLLVCLSAAEPDDVMEPTNKNYWFAAICVCGIILINSMNQSTFITPEFIVLIGILWVMGLIAIAGESGGPYRHIVQRGLWIIVVWLVFFAIRAGAIALSSRLLDSVEVNGLWYIQRAFEVLAVGSFVGGLIAVLAFVAIRGKPMLDSFQVTLIAICVALVGLNYVRNYAGSALYGMGNSLYLSGQAQSLDLSNLAYQGATFYLPNDPRLRVHWAYVIMSQLSLTQDEAARAELGRRLDQQIGTIQQTAPFFVNSKEWADFISNYRTFANH